jgi:hypothetical protein
MLIYLKDNVTPSSGQISFTNSTSLIDLGSKRENSMFNIELSTILASTATTTSTTLSTSTTTHKPKPDKADGDQLPQDHITKPNIVAPIPPPFVSPTYSEIQIKTILECLSRLNKTCSVDLKSCYKENKIMAAQSVLSVYNATNATAVQQSVLVLEEINCGFKYSYMFNSSLNNSIENVAFGDLEKPKCMNYSVDTNTIKTCFNMNDLNLKISALNNCSIYSDELKKTQSCSLSLACEFKDLAMRDFCFKQIEPTKTLTTSTTTTSTLPTTTSTTTTTTTTTTNTTITTVTTTTTIPVKQDFLTELVDLTSKNIKEFYSKINNNLQFFYIALGLLNMLLSMLYALFFLTYLKMLFVFLFQKLSACITCLFICCFKRAGTVSSSSLDRKNIIKFRTSTSSISFKKLNNKDEDYDDENDEESEDELTGKLNTAKLRKTILTNGNALVDHFAFRLEENDYLSSSSSSSENNQFENNLGEKKKILRQLLVLLIVVFINGGMSINLLVFMNNYLASRLSLQYFYQAQHIARLFYAFLIIGHVLVLTYLDLVRRKKSERASKTNEQLLTINRKGLSGLGIFKIFRYLLKNKRHMLLVFNLIILFTVSVLQVSSIDPKILILYIRNINQNSSPDRTDDKSNDLKLESEKTIVYGVIYPLLLSTLLPLIISLVDENKTLLKLVKTRLNLIVIIWSSLLLGCLLQTILNNHLSYYLIITQNLFIYINVNSSLIQLIFIFIYFYLI